MAQKCRNCGTTDNKKRRECNGYGKKDYGGSPHNNARGAAEATEYAESAAAAPGSRRSAWRCASPKGVARPPAPCRRRGGMT